MYKRQTYYKTTKTLNKRFLRNVIRQTYRHAHCNTLHPTPPQGRGGQINESSSAQQHLVVDGNWACEGVVLQRITKQLKHCTQFTRKVHKKLQKHQFLQWLQLKLTPTALDPSLYLALRARLWAGRAYITTPPLNINALSRASRSALGRARPATPTTVTLCARQPCEHRSIDTLLCRFSTSNGGNIHDYLS